MTKRATSMSHLCKDHVHRSNLFYVWSEDTLLKYFIFHTGKLEGEYTTDVH